MQHAHAAGSVEAVLKDLQSRSCDHLIVLLRRSKNLRAFLEIRYYSQIYHVSLTDDAWLESCYDLFYEFREKKIELLGIPRNILSTLKRSGWSNLNVLSYRTVLR